MCSAGKLVETHGDQCRRARDEQGLHNECKLLPGNGETDGHENENRAEM